MSYDDSSSAIQSVLTHFMSPTKNFHWNEEASAAAAGLQHVVSLYEIMPNFIVKRRGWARYDSRGRYLNANNNGPESNTEKCHLLILDRRL